MGSGARAARAALVHVEPAVPSTIQQQATPSRSCAAPPSARRNHDGLHRGPRAHRPQFGAHDVPVLHGDAGARLGRPVDGPRAHRLLLLPPRRRRLRARRPRRFLHAVPRARTRRAGGRGGVAWRARARTARRRAGARIGAAATEPNPRDAAAFPAGCPSSSRPSEKRSACRRRSSTAIRPSRPRGPPGRGRAAAALTPHLTIAAPGRSLLRVCWGAFARRRCLRPARVVRARSS